MNPIEKFFGKIFRTVDRRNFIRTFVKEGKSTGIFCLIVKITVKNQDIIQRDDKDYIFTNDSAVYNDINNRIAEIAQIMQNNSTTELNECLIDNKATLKKF